MLNIDYFSIYFKAQSHCRLRMNHVWNTHRNGLTRDAFVFYPWIIRAVRDTCANCPRLISAVRDSSVLSVILVLDWPKFFLGWARISHARFMRVSHVILKWSSRESSVIHTWLTRATFADFLPSTDYHGCLTDKSRIKHAWNTYVSLINYACIAYIFQLTDKSRMNSVWIAHGSRVIHA